MTVKSNKSLLASLPCLWQDQIKTFSVQTLQTVLENREKALEYAKKGIEESEPEKITKEYVEKVANSMQVLARIVLKERGVLAEN